jgi:hypothetical protein
MSQVRSTAATKKEPNSSINLPEQALNIVIAGALVSIPMTYVGPFVRKIQMDKQFKLTTGLNPFSIAAGYTLTKIISTFKSSLDVSIKKKAVLDQRGVVSDKIGGKSGESIEILEKPTEFLESKTTEDMEHSLQDFESDSLNQRLSAKKLNEFKVNALTSMVLVSLDLFMNPSCNRLFWKTTHLVDPNFKIPNPITLTQKYHAATTGSLLRLAKGFPSIFGLLMQNSIKPYLPQQMNEGSKALITALITGAAITPIKTTLTNIQNKKLSTVKPNCSTENIYNLLNTHGPKAFKPTRVTLAAELIHEVSLQAIVPAADKITRNHVTPPITEALENWLSKHPVAREEVLDPGCSPFGDELGFGTSYSPRK